MSRDAAFHEALHLRRGPAAWALFFVGGAANAAGLTLLAGSAWSAVPTLLGLSLVIGTWFAGTETTITHDEIVLVRRPCPRRRRIPLDDVIDAEIVFGDSNTTYFGGWEGSRGGLGGALVESLEGPGRQVGNRSIRLHLSNGKRVQFATWRPSPALEALRGTDD